MDADTFLIAEWEALKERATLGDFVMPCCRAPAVLKTSINGLPFFAHISDECATAPETKWHQNGKAAVLAALASMGIEGHEEVVGASQSGARWEADVFFSYSGRSVVIELQRSYQHLRDFIRRQERYANSGVECYWLVRKDVFTTLQKSTLREIVKREFGNVWPTGGVGIGMLPELPVATLYPEQAVQFGLLKSATVPGWLAGILGGTYRYHQDFRHWRIG